MITTLPINPLLKMPLQRMITPFIAWFYGSFATCRSVFSLNLVGEKLGALTALQREELPINYRAVCDSFGFAGLEIWTDSDPMYAHYVTECIEYLKRGGFIYESEIPVWLCQCGAVEVVQDSYILPMGAKTYDLNNSGNLICKICKNQAIKSNRRCLLLHVPILDLKTFLIYPFWIRSEIQEIVKKFSGVNLLISRTNRRNPSLVDDASGLAIDTDFFWSFFWRYLVQSQPNEPVILATSHRTVRQAFQSVVLSNMIGQPHQGSVSVLINPTLSFLSRSGSVVSLSVDQVAIQTQLELMKWFLALGLNWHTKEALLETSRLYWIEHSIRPVEVFFEETPKTLSRSRGIEEFIRICSHTVTEILVTKLRKKRLLNHGEQIVWQLLNK